MVKEVRGFSPQVNLGASRYDAATARTLEKVAKRLGVPLETLLQANPQLRDLGNLKPGQEIKLVGLTKQLDDPSKDAAVAEAFDSAKLGEQSFEGLLRSLQFKAAPDGSGGATAAKQKATGATTAPIKFAGMVLGQNQQAQQVQVKREVGSSGGYDDKWQAMAVARLGKAEHAVVVQNPKTMKWHALETSASFQAGQSASGPQGLTVIGMPPRADIKHWSQKVTELSAALSQLEKQIGTDEGGIEKARKDLKDAQVKLAAAVLGVPESDLLPIEKSADRKVGKINIIERDNPDSLGRTGAVSGGDGFQLDKDSTIEIDLADVLSNPAGSQVTLFHEMVHLKHHELAQKWVKKYPGTIVLDPPKAFEYFKKWIADQPATELSQAEKELIVHLVKNDNATTEAVANVQSFLTALQSGDPGQAKTELVKYAKALLPGTKSGYPNPPGGSAVVAALTKELQAAYRKMPKAMQDQFDDALKAAKQALKEGAEKWKAANKNNSMPDLWISSLKVSR